MPYEGLRIRSRVLNKAIRILSLSEEDSYFPALITKSDYNFLQVLHD